jgi:DNA-binding transcriptional MerR regulator
MSKAADAFRTISEVADDLDVPKHVLRFWENRFPQIKPMKRGGGRRYYRPADLELLRGIRHLLHNEGYTIKGVQKILREQGLDVVKTCWQPGKGLQAPSPRATATSQTAKTRGTPRGKGMAAVPPPVVDRKALLARIVSELQACRALLRGESSTENAAPAPRARARR